MPSLNKVILLGNLTRDPDCKRAPSGVAVTKLRIAVNEQFRERTGALKEVACYVDVTVWDRQAEACAQCLIKGSQIIVDGRLVYDEWKTPQGEQRSRLSVRADRVQFLNKTIRPGQVAPDGHQPYAPAQEGQPIPGAQYAAPGQYQQPQYQQPQAYAPSPAYNQPAVPQEPVNGDDENLPF